GLAWRVFHAQYWGVPQRRKRIYLVADFAGGRAGKILFGSEGVSGYTPQGFRPRQGAAGAFAEGAGASGCVCLNDQGGSRMDVTEDVAATLRALFVPKVYGICSKDSNAMKSENPKSGFYEAETSRRLDANGGNPTCNQ